MSFARSASDTARSASDTARPASDTARLAKEVARFAKEVFFNDVEDSRLDGVGFCRQIPSFLG